MILQCQFGMEVFPCSSLFKGVITDVGYCCTFNMVHTKFMFVNPAYVSHFLNCKFFDSFISFRLSFMSDVQHSGNIIDVDWTPEKGFPVPIKSKIFSPLSAPAAGVEHGLRVLLNLNKMEYFCSTSNGPGFKVTVHSPVELPLVQSRGILVEPGKEILLRVNVNKLEADDIKDISPENRQCLFEDEKMLKVFKTFTRRNCENECETDRVWDACACVPFHALPIDGNETICGLRHAKCLTNTQIRLSISNSALDCEANCTEGCVDVNYSLDSFQTYLRSKSNYSIKSRFISKLNKSTIEENYSLVTIFFRDSTFRSERKSPYIGLTEFLCK